LQCVAVCCSVLQCVAVCCSVLQCIWCMCVLILENEPSKMNTFVFWISKFELECVLILKNRVSVCSHSPNLSECVFSSSKIEWVCILILKNRVSVCSHSQKLSECVFSLSKIEWMCVLILKNWVYLCSHSQKGKCVLILKKSMCVFIVNVRVFSLSRMIASVFSFSKMSPPLATRRGGDQASKYLDLQIEQFSCLFNWVTGTPVYSRENLFEILGTPLKTCTKFSWPSLF